MGCCAHCSAVAAKFDRRTAERDLRRYARKGPDATTRLILSELRQRDASGRDVLDIGGGVGIASGELLRAGARHALLVEAAPAYLTTAKERLADRMESGQFEALAGDFVDLDPSPSADLVILDRVVCCYPDFRSLLSRAGGSARSTLSLSYPRYRWYVRIVVALENLWRQLRRNPFRTFVHPPIEMAAGLAGTGLRLVVTRATFVWVVEVWAR